MKKPRIYLNCRLSPRLIPALLISWAILLSVLVVVVETALILLLEEGEDDNE